MIIYQNRKQSSKQIGHFKPFFPPETRSEG